MKPPSQIVQDFINDQQIGWFTAKNLFIGSEPESPTECLTTFDEEGGWVQDPANNYDMDHVQIRVRSNGYSQGWSKIKEIVVLLNGINPFNYGDDRVEGIWIQLPPAMIGRDNKNNYIFTVTIRMLIIRNDKGNRQ